MDLLGNIARQKFDRSFEVIVVVDGSQDGTGEALRAFRPEFPLRIIEQQNLGQARARNAGAAHAKGEVILFLDDDMEAHPRLLQEHRQSHDQGAEVAQGHVPVHPDAPVNIVTKALDSWVNEIAHRQSAPGYKPNYNDFIGGQTSIRRSLFEAMGGFDERFTAGGSYGNEDAELGYRLIRSGRKITFNAEAISRQRCRVDAETFLKRARQLGQADVALVRKHPEL
ncbi:MAG TPA: glycosyltransferase, partial [Phycisphaerae bacterium]|nr:glycosyltransferase [Phycisphaerae bacterium]